LFRKWGAHIELGHDHTVLLQTPEGREFLLVEVDGSEDAEIQAIRKNRELLEFLEERSRDKETYTLEEVREKLNL
jgi:hypothetical protein